MRVEIFSIFDSKAVAFMQPFFAASPGIALRMFRETVLDRTTSLAKYPEDFTLHHVGTFDDQTGELKSLQPPLNLGNAVTFMPESGHAA